MRILWVKAGKLLPVDTGGKIRSYNLLRQLAARHETVLLSYYGGARDADYEEEIARQLPGAVTVHTGAPHSGSLARGLDYLRRLPSSAPYAVTKFTSPKVRRLIREWDAARRFDVAVCDFLSASLNFPRETRTPTVDRKSTRLNSSHDQISYAVFCLKKKKTAHVHHTTATPGSHRFEKNPRYHAASLAMRAAFLAKLEFTAPSRYLILL